MAENRTNGMSRREFLRTLGLGAVGAAAAISGLPSARVSARTSSSATAATRAQGGEIVLRLHNAWLFVLPEEEPADGWSGAHVAMRQWLDAHPNVRFEYGDYPIWDGVALKTAIAGGTAPALYATGAAGGWTIDTNQPAFLQGFMADITDQWDAMGITEKLNPAAFADEPKFTAAGRRFGIPEVIAGMHGIAIRTDLLAETGLEIPSYDWTWDDLRTYAAALKEVTGNKGVGFTNWMLYHHLGTYGVNFGDYFVGIPAPEQNWNWRNDVEPYLDTVVEVVERHRAIMFEDESLLADVTGIDPLQALYDGTVGMVNMWAEPFTRGTAPGMVALAGEREVALEEVAVMVPAPRGPFGFFHGGARPETSPASFNPDLTTEELDAVVSLFSWMLLEEGRDIERATNYERNGDLLAVFGQFPFVRAQQSINGVDATAEEALGEAFVRYTTWAGENARHPHLQTFVAPEQERPSAAAWTDTISSFTFDPGDMDIRTMVLDAQRLDEEVTNTFTTTMPDDEWVVAVGQYYDALNAFFAEKLPEFNTELWAPFYAEKIAPALGM